MLSSIYNFQFEIKYIVINILLPILFNDDFILIIWLNKILSNVNAGLGHFPLKIVEKEFKDIQVQKLLLFIYY